MDGVTEEVIDALIPALKQTQPVWLVTVVSTWGSSPRAPGSMMLWSPSTGVVGSVSGGCIEDDLVEKFRSAHFSENTMQKIIYGDAEGEAPSLKLPCGGRLQLLIEPLHKTPRIPLWETLAEYLRARQGCARVIDIDSNTWSVKASQPFALLAEFSTLTVYLGPYHKLLIVGANQIAHYLAQFAQALNFVVTVCDPSDDVASSFSENHFRFLKRYPDGLVEQEFCDSASALVAVSHDPRLDDMALLDALPSKAFYVGAMGSQQTSVARRKRLRDLGLSAAQIDKLRAPIGLDIGSKTPAEIAISIAADLVKASKVSYAK